MPWYRMPNGNPVHIKLGGARNRTAPLPCLKCGWISSFLCDWKVDGRDCDAPICEAHAFEVGPDKHLCPAHVEAYRAWLTAQCIPLQ